MKTIEVVPCEEFDELVRKTYNRPYCIQQQNNTALETIVKININNAQDYPSVKIEGHPDVWDIDGVSFADWINRDPKEKLNDMMDDWEIDLWWQRHFYPELNTIAKDLYQKGLLDKKTYKILISE